MATAFSGLFGFLNKWSTAYSEGVGKGTLQDIGQHLMSNDAISKIGADGLPTGQLFGSLKYAFDSRIANSPKLMAKLGKEVTETVDGKERPYRNISNLDRAKSLFYHAHGDNAGEISYKRVGAAGIAGSYLAYRALS